MKKGKINYEDELYDDDDYYDEDDEYYDEEYEEEEEEKPKKNKNNKNKNTNKNNNTKSNQNLNQNKNKNQNQNKNDKKNQDLKSNNNLNLSKKESNTSSLAISPSSSSSIANSTNEKIKKEEKEKQIMSVKDFNDIKSYPKIDYGKKYTSNNSDDKPTINLVIIGHVDSGKSTMIGHLLYLLKEIDNKEVHKNLKVKSNKGEQNRDTLQFAFATDEASDERERGVTIDIGFKNFSTKNKNIVALDAPGHRDFIPNMISGTSAADAALLVIDSGLQAFNAGFFGGGQTREHALLAKTLGVSQLIVAINKLELFNWKKERYDEIVQELSKFLIEELGFDEKRIKYIPVSGLTGDNLIKPISSKNANWYKGPTLEELIDNLEPPQRAIDAPVRFIINDISKNITGGQGLNLYGKLESGIISINTEYIILPSGNKEKIKSITLNKKNVQYIIPGQQAELILNVNKNSKEELLVEPGNVLSSEKYQIPCIKKFKAHIKTYELKTPISLGQKMMFYLQGQKTQITIKKIERIFNEGSKVSRNNTRFIPKNFYADIIIESENKICAELYTLNKKLSTFALRISGETQAMGYITEFIE